MNYKLSTYANRATGKSGYVISADGSILNSKVSKFVGNNIKENALRQVYFGLKACKNLVSHLDILIVEVQNSQIYNWLDGSIEYKEYTHWLDKIFEVLELLDCRYNFYFNANTFAKSFIKDKDFTKQAVCTLDDMMSDFN